MSPQELFQLALGHRRAGQRGQAESAARQVLQLDPQSHQAHYLLGALLMERREPVEATGHFTEAAALAPDTPEYHNGLGSALILQARFVEAADAFRRAVALRANYRDALHNLGRVLIQLGGADEAIATLTRAIEIEPNFPPAHAELANAYRKRGQLDLALASAREAIRLAPQFSFGHNILGLVLADRDEHAQAAGAFYQAIRLNPGASEPHINLARALRGAGRLSDAVVEIRKAIELRPSDAGAKYNLGVLQAELGDAAGAMESFRAALRLRPDFAGAHSGMLLQTNYDSRLSNRERFEEHLRFGRIHAPGSTTESAAPAPRGRAARDRKIRLGYVSPDFRNHSVGYFIEPILAHHDRERFEVYCYSDAPRPDSVTARLRKLPLHWRDIPGESDASVAARVADDAIDVLIDLAGHTERNRLPMFAKKPAPVQVTYLGYPNTTGLSQIDYRLTDAIADPVGESDSLHAEKLIRLPNGFLCYRPPEDAPPVAPTAPAGTSRPVTFCSFNNLLKITPEAIALWARILADVDGSTLLLKNKSLAEPAVLAGLRSAFAGHGIDADRLDLRPPAPSTREHLRAYQSADVALDTFPYNGTTTTCEALFMGVPVITLSGDTHAARVGESILHHAGLPELITRTADHYVQCATDLAKDSGRLAGLREGMRDRLTRCPLLDGKLITRDIETALTSVVG